MQKLISRAPKYAASEKATEKQRILEEIVLSLTDLDYQMTNITELKESRIRVRPWHHEKQALADMRTINYHAQLYGRYDDYQMVKINNAYIKAIKDATRKYYEAMEDATIGYNNLTEVINE